MNDFLKVYPVKTFGYKENGGVLTILFISDKKSVAEKWFLKKGKPV
jgi:hypothetical protein